MRVWAVALMVFLSGCAGEAEPTLEDIPVPEPQTSATTGAIGGVVVDETIRPVQGATVTMNGDQRVTDADGTFAFEGLEPGTYFLKVNATDFEGAQSSAQVVAGDVAKVRILLSPDMAPVPVATTVKFDAHMVFSDFYAVYIITDTLGPNELCHCKFEADQVDDLETVILEAQWASSTPRALEHQMWWDVFSDTGSWQSGWASSPTLMRHAGSQFNSDDPSIIVLVSSDLQPDIEQSIEIFLTQFAVAPAPEDWSFIDGSE